MRILFARISIIDGRKNGSLLHPMFVVLLVLAGASVLMKGDGCSKYAAGRLFCLLKAELPWRCPSLEESNIITARHSGAH